ncbi:hypothetical protein IscW_ISCW010451 [Ixodes scapularis]|uniref:tRNA-splicing endonuclease subunit Sen54 N-terminal domain-containing protein n=1 Tax=Ixodes scapularis TaxID=6945 RepID=B7Q6C9_IXOSC|nr:hypothetical protein IscW_ISCW010451 [Ixodes scapularis]|eukprot:XP_002402892.1 hypothetical protein IscW_ISCW010451 [Ixodes scapularis]
MREEADALPLSYAYDGRRRRCLHGYGGSYESRPASQGSDTNADDTGQEDGDHCFRLPSGGDIFRAPCIREPKAWTRSGQKLLASKDPEAEATQLQALTEERAQAVACVGAYKLADVAEATWHEEKIVLTRHKGPFLSFMGRAVGRQTLLHPLETLFLVLSGQLTLKRDGVPVSLPEAHELFLDGRDDVDQYRVYAHLLGAGYVVLLPRTTPKPPPEPSPEAQNNDSNQNVVQVIPVKQAKTGAAQLNSSVPDPAVGVGHRPAPQDDGYRSALLRLPQGSAHPWSQLKGCLAGAQRTRALLGGEGVLLWRGPIKPLVFPSRHLSLGGIVSQLSLVQEVDLVKSCRHLRVPQARTLDVYLVAVGFRKTCPGLPEYRVAMVRWDERVPTLRDLVRSSLGDGVPLVSASVDSSGQVQLFTLEPLVVPHFAQCP